MARPIVPHPVAPGDVHDPDGPVPVGWRRTRTGQLKRRNIVWRLRRYLVGTVAMAVLAASAVGASFWASVELPTRKTPLPSYFCDSSVTVGCNRDNAFAEQSADESGEQVRADEIPEVMVLALVAAEDKEFFAHKGVAPTGIARAVWHDLRTDSKLKQGGSTLTQQLVKVLTKDDRPSLSRKIKEAVQAMKLEQELPKREILARYFNSVYFGRNATGIAAAVRAYFGPEKKVSEIGLKEAAYLAAVIREPEQVDANLRPTDPKRERQRTYATGRRKDVLNTMLELGYITKAERDEVAEMGWDYVIEDNPASRSKIFRHEDIGGQQWIQYVKAWLKNNVNITEDRLQNEGLRVYTSLDPELQAKAYEAVEAVLPREHFDAEHTPEASLASLDDQGFLRAMVGSRDGQSLGLNMAVCADNSCAGRQPGSSFKPVVLATYLEEGNRLDKLFDNDKALEVKNEKPIENVGGEYTPPVDLLTATVKSYNVVYARVMEELGDNQKVINMAKELGLMEDGDFRPYAQAGPRLGIGDPVNATPLKMATIYSTFANRGRRIDPYPVVKVTDSVGTTIWEADPARGEQVIKPDVADQVNYVLKSVVETPGGTGYTNGRVFMQTVAGKTGSQALETAEAKRKKENSDAWFVGHSCKLSAAVWIGHQKTTKEIGELEGVQPVNGSTLPAKIFSEYMNRALLKRGSCPFERPASAIPTTTQPPTSLPWWMQPGADWRDRFRDPDRPTTTLPWWLNPNRGRPTTTEPEEPTTTRRNGPNGPSTTQDTVRPRPGQGGAAQGEPASEP